INSSNQLLKSVIIQDKKIDIKKNGVNPPEVEIKLKNLEISSTLRIREEYLEDTSCWIEFSIPGVRNEKSLFLFCQSYDCQRSLTTTLVQTKEIVNLSNLYNQKLILDVTCALKGIRLTLIKIEVKMTKAIEVDMPLLNVTESLQRALHFHNESASRFRNKLHFG
ncbi:hypothetical protein HMI56_004321, partial [Coelomomyces lativittatus]